MEIDSQRERERQRDRKRDREKQRKSLIDMKMLNKRMTLANVYSPSSGDHPEFF